MKGVGYKADFAKERLTAGEKLSKPRSMGLSLDSPIQYVKGVGPKLGEIFRRKGLATVADLLECYPRTYEDRRAARNIASLRADELVSFVATIRHIRSFQMGKSRRKIYEIQVADDSGAMTCKFFRIPYRGYFERFQSLQKVRVIGKVLAYRGRLEFHHPEIREYIPEEEFQEGLIPIYVEMEGVSSKKVGSAIAQAFAQLDAATPEGRAPVHANEGFLSKRERGITCSHGIPDFLPEAVRLAHQLPDRATALRAIHFPPADAGRDFLLARSPFHRRIIFEEFFWLEILLGLRRTSLKKSLAPLMRADLSLVEQLKARLPFTLTEGQQEVFAEILADLGKPQPMGRLVQGDVGSGKTLVALMSALVAKQNHLQTALMVPTEILSEQHFRSAYQYLAPLGVRVGLLTGSQKSGERQAVLQALAQGELDLCVGTHALIQEAVEFRALGLVIVDEQHRFGVDQRKKLIQKGLSPHFLIMTATPIPRTLAMTVYGDLDVSVIRDRPKGRQPIVTRVTYQSKRPQVLDFVAQHVRQGRQAYVIYPLVEESEKIDLKNAIEEYGKLCAEFPDFRLGLLHGKMKAQEKQAVMEAFRKNDVQILVATTVVEVGVDVPNANIMLIEHAERFGLAQLHQLRGRVGRGSHKSFCVLMLGHAVSDESRTRALIMERSSDGFEIAEADLELRGPGDFLGTRQAGLPGFHLAHLLRDADLLKQARQAAFDLLAQDPRLERVENRGLREGWLRQQQAGLDPLIG